MKRYNDLNSYFRSIFGHRVHKIAVDSGLSCPNRDGKIATGGCIYCNDHGSGNGFFARGISITEQIVTSMGRIAKRFKAKKFIAYFQSFTNTYAPIEHLECLWDEALSVDGVVGLAVATRPDCISGPVLDLLEQYAKKYLVWVEYGLQSAHNQTLRLINRGHDVECFTRALDLTRRRKIGICAHVILGLPNETSKSMLETADFLSHKGVNAVKIHFLYVIKNTVLEMLYKTGRYECLKKKEYILIVCDFIERLAPEMVIHRLTSDPNPNELVAPIWALDKTEMLSSIHGLLDLRNSWQGKRYKDV